MSTAAHAQSVEGASVNRAFHVAEFDDAARTRSVAEVLRAHLEDAETQLRLERRRARRAERRVQELGRAVENWHELIAEYERASRSTIHDRRN